MTQERIDARAGMSAQHTPGPFELSNGLRVYAPGKGGPLLATVHDLPRAPGEAKANAVLFATSSELLGVAQLILRGYGVTFHDAALRTLLADVVAKATGSASC
ncbi:hypothetical protein [Methylibium petroleiphilum]